MTARPTGGITSAHKTREIEGYTYGVRPLPATLGLQLGARFGTLVAPALRAVPATPAKTEAALEAQLTEATTAGLAELFGNPAFGAHLEAFVTAFRSCTEVEWTDEHGEPCSASLADLRFFDSHFAARYGALLSWLAFAAEVNLGSFLGMLKPLLGKRPAPTP